MACAAEGGGSSADTDSEPESIASEASPETPALCGSDGGVALTSECGDFRGVVGGIQLYGRELSLARAAILNEVVERLQIGCWNLSRRRVGKAFGYR